MTAAAAPRDPALARADYLYSLAIQACVYCWPLYEMQRMRAATSARKAPGQGFAGDSPASSLRWCNLFTHERALLTAGKSRVVMPNNDTLYTNAWLDLAAGPLVIALPDTGARYYVLGLLDYYTNPFAHVGTRTTGNGAGAVLLSGPGWQGEVPAQFGAPGRHLRSATDWVWIIGRILVNGAADLAAVHALQDRFEVHALADWQAGRPSPARRFDAACAPRSAFSAEHFRTMVNDALRNCPPAPADALLVAQFRPIGIGAEAPPLESGLAQDALQRACATVQALLASDERTVFPPTGAPAAARGAWRMPAFLGASFGADLLRRAFVARQGIGQLGTQEAAYLRCETDVRGQPLHGAHRYILRFAPAQLPPVDAFWSITMYDDQDCLLVPNAIERYAIGDRTEGLVRDADGGLTLVLQQAPPLESAQRANWLPAPAGGFFLCLRAYLPQAAQLDGGYRPPDPVAPD